MSYPASIDALNLAVIVQDLDGTKTETFNVPASAPYTHRLGATLTGGLPTGYQIVPKGAFQIGTPGAPSGGVLVTGDSLLGLVSNGVYKWAVSNITVYGETPPGTQYAPGAIGVGTGYQLTMPANSQGTTDAPVIVRKLWRTKNGGSTLYFVRDVDLDETTVIDGKPDDQLIIAAPGSNTSGVIGTVTATGSSQTWTEQAPGTSLAAGDFIVDYGTSATGGTITFAAADAGKSVTLTWTAALLVNEALVKALVQALKDLRTLLGAAANAPSSVVVTDSGDNVTVTGGVTAVAFTTTGQTGSPQTVTASSVVATASTNPAIQAPNGSISALKGFIAGNGTPQSTPDWHSDGHSIYIEANNGDIHFRPAPSGAVGDNSLESILHSTGAWTFAGGVTAASATITGALTAGSVNSAAVSATSLSASTALVTGALSAGSASVTGSLTAGSVNSAAISATSLSASTALVTGNLSVGGALTVTGTITGSPSLGGASGIATLDSASRVVQVPEQGVVGIRATSIAGPAVNQGLTAFHAMNSGTQWLSYTPRRTDTLLHVEVFGSIQKQGAADNCTFALSANNGFTLSPQNFCVVSAQSNQVVAFNGLLVLSPPGGGWTVTPINFFINTLIFNAGWVCDAGSGAPSDLVVSMRVTEVY